MRRIVRKDQLFKLLYRGEYEKGAAVGVFMLRTIILFLLLVIGIAARGEAQVCGDADGNGQVTVTDGVNVLRAAAGLSGACPLARCDIDGDGSVTVTDGVNVLRAAARLQARLTCADLIIDTVKDDDGIFGKLTKIPGGLTEPPSAAKTVQSIAFESSFVSGQTNTITVAYDIGGPLRKRRLPI